MHQSPADRTSSPWRNWFRRTVEPECQLSLRETRAIVAGADQLLEDCEAGAPSWASRPSPGAPETAAVLRGSQPMAAALGGALASLSAPGVFEDAVHLRVMAVLARDVGVGRPTASRYDDFHRVMAVHRLQQEARPRPQLPDSRLPDDLFAAPTFVMALSRRPDLFAAELLGWDHHIRSEGLLAPWAWLRDAGIAGDWERLDLRRTDDGDDGLAVEIMWCIEAADLDPARVRWGAEAAATLHGQWEAALWRWTASTADPVEAFVDLIRRRSREALVYHDTTRLEGRSIQGWFEEARHDPRAFVDAIGRSRYVRPGQPERSHLLTTLTDFGSPMFRVFSPEDCEIISRWIVSLADEAPVDVAANSRRAAPRGPDLSRHLAAVSDVADQGESPKSIREAYVALQGRHCSPAVLRFAEDYVDHWLSLARHSLDRHPFPLPEDIPSPGDLREWLLAAHDKHADAVDPEDGDQHLPSREDLVNSTIQLAPLTLIDGSWLMGFSDLSLASTRIGFSLFETYWDELGNGDIEINHPKLYRDVLDGMDVDLPPTHSPAFAHSELLRDEAFELPVYWLAIGRFPLRRQPEVLGLNLAMELSGVGGTYRTAHRALSAHGFPTVFVDIHNTIDNVSTGHSAWAAEAVEAYVENARALGGTPDDLETLWRRVRTGFASLDPDRTKRFVFTGSRVGDTLWRLTRGAATHADASSPERDAATTRRTQGFVAAHNEPLAGPSRRSLAARFPQSGVRR